MILNARFSIALVAAACIVAAHPLAAQEWIAPTPAELSMISIPEVPGAAAVYLNVEEVDDDLTHFQTFYARIKILSEAGKDYANVEVPFEKLGRVAVVTGAGKEQTKVEIPFEEIGAGTKVAGIAGRTIQPDGTIVLFTGKPFEKTIMKTDDLQVKEKVFTLPAAQVGSIIEYRFRLEYSFDSVNAPTWLVQKDLYVRQAHYIWRPTLQDVISHMDGDNVASHESHTAILPRGVEVKRVFSPNQRELTIHDIPPIPHEDYMPPLDSVSYRVIFYYTEYNSEAAYWQSAGKRWSQQIDEFVGSFKHRAKQLNDSGGAKGFKLAVDQLISPTDTTEQKLRKFYAAIMAMENTDYTRERTRVEDKVEGLRTVKKAEDILESKRGSGDQLAELFIAMARAEGIKAYAMGVADRDRRVFQPEYLNIDQLDDIIAIVNVDGKEVPFDPGNRYCAFGHLSWQHAQAAGLRQIDGGTALAVAPAETYATAHSVRIGDLTLDDVGKFSGTFKFSFTGDPALRWRHAALTGDEASLKKQLTTSLEAMLPTGTEVGITGIEHLTDYDVPLLVNYHVSGALAIATGKRLLVPASILEQNAKALFPEEKRDLPVDLHYPQYNQDSCLFRVPATFTIESLPANAEIKQPGFAYSMTVRRSGQMYLIQRDVVIGQPVIGPENYATLRSFYSKLQTKDQETAVLTRAAP